MRGPGVASCRSLRPSIIRRVTQAWTRPSSLEHAGQDSRGAAGVSSAASEEPTRICEVAVPAEGEREYRERERPISRGTLRRSTPGVEPKTGRGREPPPSSSITERSLGHWEEAWPERAKGPGWRHVLDKKIRRSPPLDHEWKRAPRLGNSAKDAAAAWPREDRVMSDRDPIAAYAAARTIANDGRACTPCSTAAMAGTRPRAHQIH